MHYFTLMFPTKFPTCEILMIKEILIFFLQSPTNLLIELVVAVLQSPRHWKIVTANWGNKLNECLGDTPKQEDK